MEKHRNDHHRGWRSAAVFVLLTGPGACGDDGAAGDGVDTTGVTTSGIDCVPLEMLACTCDDGMAGLMTCTPSGDAFGPCQCGLGDSGTGSSTGASTTGSGTDSDTDTDTETDTGGGGPLEIGGQWIDGFAGNHEIDDALWRQDFGFAFAVSAFSNDEDVLVAQNDGNNPFNPGMWSRFEWTTTPDDRLWYCQVVFDGETEVEALDPPPADASDPQNGGCGGFSWSELLPSLGPEIMGSYTDDFAGMHSITADDWQQDFGLFHIDSYSNIDDDIVAQNDSDNMFNPDQWSRFEWTTDMGGDLWYCQVVFDAPTKADALLPPPADDADPASGGCGGFAWTMLIPM